MGRLPSVVLFKTPGGPWMARSGVLAIFVRRGIQQLSYLGDDAVELLLSFVIVALVGRLIARDLPTTYHLPQLFFVEQGRRRRFHSQIRFGGQTAQGRQMSNRRGGDIGSAGLSDCASERKNS